MMARPDRRVIDGPPRADLIATMAAAPPAAAAVRRAIKYALAVCAAAMLVAAPAMAAEPTALIVHYNERPPHHFSKGGPQGAAIVTLRAALEAAHLPYQLRNTPAKQQLVLLRANAAPACMLAWVALPGREQDGKFSDVIYRDAPRGTERRLWCTRATPDETIQRLNAALPK